MENKKLGNVLIWSDRWSLGALSGYELMNIGFVSVLIGFLFILFHLFGNTVENVNSNSAFVWMIARWGDKISFGADYSHGYIIPFFSLYVVWVKRRLFFEASKRVSNWGLMVIVGSLAIHWLGVKMQQPRLSLISLIGLIWGIPFYFWGWQVAKLLIFPCSYLIYCVPLNFLNAVSGVLQRLATIMGFATLEAMGIECQRVGSQLISPYFRLNVEAACSGLRSLLALSAITAIYAYFTQKTFLKKWVLFLVSIPIAVLANVARINSIALVSITAGQEYGAGLHHDWAGYVLYVVALLLMVGCGKLLTINYRELFSSWKEAYLNRS
ncbi:MAG TPA: exosortase/archaeosortase family protein [Pontiella sp.]